MNSLIPHLIYDGPIFDAHTHVVDIEQLSIQVKIGEKYGVTKAILIVHGNSIESIERRYPGKFIFAKYFSSALFLDAKIDQAIKATKKMRDEGYSVAKLHFAPFWRVRLQTDSFPAVSDPVFDELFETFREFDIPVLIHISDPDTYYATKYSQPDFETKEEHLQQFENRMKRTPMIHYQVAHFGAQPEINRLDNLARWFHENPTLTVDTGSARWMARELSKDPEKARKFLITHANRILFGSDCVSRTSDTSYYEGRYEAERILWETNVRHRPLPFVDSDTVDTGGTFINGLELPERVLVHLYWENAERFYLE